MTKTKAEIPNPVTLTFRVTEVAWREESTIHDSGKEIPAIPLREIFADDLERTLWMAIKCRHITSQHFNHQIRKAAASLQAYPPTDPWDLHCRIQCMTGRHVDDQTQRSPDRFCEELFRYVLSVLDGGTLRLEYQEPPK